ncbi:hypothetical protein NNA36_12885 [Shimia sp. CNT1-13L.2]|uniref:hypothetical protein n=1 Tax=Shimia sp. CNT1-13L.2 TaxID=2959663 RepID=UPI0020CCDECF|nr:hypothetical protein [Shimia sp. CNT1-13L.2]MCP9482858.1 hypothetical protein [Shimia sp. CNT1-13L.2]
MFRIFAALACVVGLNASPAQAQQLMGEYLTWLGPRDIVNSSGTPLTTFGAVLAQDRANFHRFGKRDDYDGNDPFFHRRDLRANLPAYYRAGQPVARYIFEDVMSGRGHYVFVRIFGSGGRIPHVNVYEGAG